MIAITGDYYDGRSSRRQAATLFIAADGSATLSTDPAARFGFADLHIDERVGNAPRSIYFPNGAKFETTQNDKVDAALARRSAQRAGRFLHALETHKRYILVAIVAVSLSFWGLMRYGIPAGAKAAAFALPAEASLSIGRGSLEILDETMLAPTTLDVGTRERLSQRFAAMTEKAQSDIPLTIVFRHGKRIGANALALPSGTIIVTDELVKLAEHDDEVIAVLAHEIGHVVHRHGLRRIMQDSVVALVAILIAGDVSSTGTLIAALPTVLVELQYSQAFEREADAYSYAYLKRNGIDTVHFANLMRRLDERHRIDVPAYLSSHPPSADRIAMFSAT